MEHEIRKQKAKAMILFDDILTAKKSQQLRMHFKKNHSGRAQEPLLSLCLSSHHSSPLLHHHHQSLFQAPRKTQLTSTKGQGNPLLRYRTTPNRLLARKVTRNSPSGGGRVPQLSMTGRGRWTGMWQDNAGTVAQSAMVHGGVGKV